MLMQPIDIELKRLWEAGHTSSEIATALGISRSAVMGRVHRLRAKGVELEARPVAAPKPAEKVVALRPPKEVRRMPFVMPQYPPKPAKAEKPVKEELPVEPPKPEKARPVTLLELKPMHCRYIVNQHKTRGAMYCGEPKKVRSYCEEHAKLCYYPLIRKERPKGPPSENTFRFEPLNGTRL